MFDEAADDLWDDLGYYSNYMMEGGDIDIDNKQRSASDQLLSSGREQIFDYV